MPSPRSRGNPSKIFISYRRSESAAYAGRLSDQLRTHFGTQVIFIDIESIEPGRDFVEAIDDAVGSCKILLVVIGRQWLTCANQHGRRLDDPKDFVRLEIAAALKRNIRVIPVLVQGAAMPREEDLPGDIAPLARRNAWEVSDIRWHQDVGELIKKIAEDIRPKHSASPWTSNKGLLIQLAAAMLFVSAVIYAFWSFPLTRRQGPPQSCRKTAEGETRYYEAEDASLAGGARRDREYLGFSGYSFVSGYGVDAAVGADGASTTFEVDAPSDGQYRVELCYANGNDSPRPLTIYVNGERIKRTILPNASQWNIWLTQEATLPLRAGRNAISYRKSEYDDGEVNLDFIGVGREPIRALTILARMPIDDDIIQSYFRQFFKDDDVNMRTNAAMIAGELGYKALTDDIRSLLGPSNSEFEKHWYCTALANLGAPCK